MDIELLISCCNFGSSFVLAGYLQSQRNFALVLGEIEEIRHSYYDDESWIVFPDGPSRSLQFNYRWEEVHDQGEITKFLVNDNIRFHEFSDYFLPSWVETEYWEEQDAWCYWFNLYESLKYY